MDHDVEPQWGRIVAWLAVNAPAALDELRAAPSPADVAAAEDVTGRPWPEALRAWYRLQGGWERSSATGLLPGWGSPFSIDESIEQWRMYQEVMAGVAEGDACLTEELRLAETAQAGTIAGGFLSSFLPIADDGSGDALFVDLRPGPHSGCVTDYDKVEADNSGVLWMSLADMFADIADCLESGRPNRYWRPRVLDGYPYWEFGEDLYPPRPYPPRVQEDVDAES